MTNEILSIDEVQKTIESYEQEFNEVNLAQFNIDYTFDSEGDIKIQLTDGNTEFNLSKDPSIEVLNKLGISSRVISEYGENYELFSSMIEYSKSRRADNNCTFISVLGDVVSVEKGGIPYLSVQEAWEGIRGLPGLRGAQWVQNYEGSGFELRLISENTFSPPRQVDDISESGLWTRINGEAQVGSYVRRLVCSNGMMANKSVVEFNVKANSRDELLDKYVDSALTALDRANKLAQDFVNLAEHRLENPANYLNSVMREQKIPNRYRTEIMDLLPTLPDDPTAYDVINLVTAYGRRQESLKTRSRFEWLGGKITELFSPDEIRCSHCAHIIDTVGDPE
jgi:hypothetical protein